MYILNNDPESNIPSSIPTYDMNFLIDILLFPSFNNDLLCTCYVSGSMLGKRNTKAKTFLLGNLHSIGENNIYTNVITKI